MSIQRSPVIVAGAYLIIAGLAFASELYVRFFDRGNSEMAGLMTFLFTMPSSFLVEKIFGAFGYTMGGSDFAFVAVLSLSLLLNASLLYLVIEAIRKLPNLLTR